MKNIKNIINTLNIKIFINKIKSNQKKKKNEFNR